MPWSISKGGGTCSVDQFAVLKQADGSTAGCHETQSDAKKQLAALYVAEKKKRSVPMRGNALVLAGEAELRGLPAEAAGLEIRSVGGDGSDGAPEERFAGYAAVYNTRTAIGNPSKLGFFEQIAPGAFTKTLKEGDARFLIDHNPYYVVSRVSAGTLTLRSDERGLAVDSALDRNLSYVKDLAANVRNGNITGMSFGFTPVKDEWSKIRHVTGDGTEIDAELRTLLEMKVPEVSGVTFPAYTKTQAELKSVASAMRSRVELHGDLEAIERRAEWWPELPELCGVQLPHRTIIDLGSVRTTKPADAVTAPSESASHGLPPCSCGETRDASAPHSTPTSDRPFNADANEENVPDDASFAMLKGVYAWVDPNNPTKAGARALHHFVAGDGTVGAASTKAAGDVIAALNSRKGMGVPADGKQAVYEHMAKHLQDAGAVVPPMRRSDPSLCPECGGETRGATSSHSTATSDKPWDAGANEKNIPNDAGPGVLKQEFAWVPNTDPTKSGSKFPHHFVSSDGSVGAASTVACSAIIAALNGGRGGTTIPASDKQGVYAHAAKHLRDGGKKPPPLQRSDEPADTTRSDNDDNHHDDDDVEPAASTQHLAPSIQDRMRVLQARYHLPV